MNKIKRIGFLFKDLAPNQLVYQVIKSGNELLKTTDHYDLCVFYRNFSVSVLEANFATMTAYEAFNYSGIMVATDLQSASNIVKWPGPNQNKMYFYVNDLEWIRFRDRMPYEDLANIYMNPKLNLIARSDTHKEIIESVWRPVTAVVENGNVFDFVKVVFDEEKT